MNYQIITYGCQANKSDSERIASLLEEFGLTPDSNNPDLIIINICSIRQSAIDRALSTAQKMRSSKTKVILTGCIVDKDLPKMRKLSDYILRIKELPRWPEILNLGKSKLVIDYFKIIPTPENRFLGYIPIMSGCNNFCTYCVVPYTRGEEYSRPFGEIIEEAESLVKKGAKEIWLIGQNVSSYRDGKSGLAEVIKEINNLPGDFWIGFLSSHPKDLNENILTTVRESEKAMEYINLPVQSGDDFILRKMNRPYTISEYKRSVATIMEILPEATLSTDIIVGFPNEDQRAFGNTVRLMEDLKFDMAYISKYSPRAGTNSFVMKNNVAESEKIERQKILTKILELSALERNKEMDGGNEVVIVQEKKRGFLFGKTKKYKTVKFKGPESMIGSFVKVKIKKALPWRLEAEISQK